MISGLDPAPFRALLVPTTRRWPRRQRCGSLPTTTMVSRDGSRWRMPPPARHCCWSITSICRLRRPTAHGMHLCAGGCRGASAHHGRDTGTARDSADLASSVRSLRHDDECRYRRRKWSETDDFSDACRPGRGLSPRAQCKIWLLRRADRPWLIIPPARSHWSRAPPCSDKQFSRYRPAGALRAAPVAGWRVGRVPPDRSNIA